ncbi:MAG TPA: GWxTD domain-containing protein, partial [Terriglobales bacterium]|nr:GWxTD domain-containing protein [Terriglobales bacterium]
MHFRTGQLSALCSVTVLAFLLVNSLCFAAKTREKDLSERYRKWLAQEVVYIITNEEKQAFLNLDSDEARDKFIEQFWEIRNPAPGAPTNPYKEEIYRRIQYANEWFGKESGTEGWRTDMGRVYITLGEPKQRAKYLGAANVRPMEIWFYSSAHPALPPFFSVVFYQREAGGAFRLYSPYMDGPTKLISSASTEGDRVASLKVIDKELGREV